MEGEWRAGAKLERRKPSAWLSVRGTGRAAPPRWLVIPHVVPLATKQKVSDGWGTGRSWGWMPHRSFSIPLLPTAGEAPRRSLQGDPGTERWDCASALCVAMRNTADPKALKAAERHVCFFSDKLNGEVKNVRTQLGAGAHDNTYLLRASEPSLSRPYFQLSLMCIGHTCLPPHCLQQGTGKSCRDGQGKCGRNGGVQSP